MGIKEHPPHFPPRRGNKFMYDSHIYSSDYKNFKDTIADIIHGDDTTTDIEALADKIQEVYDDNKMSSSQYDDLMRYIQDLM